MRIDGKKGLQVVVGVVLVGALVWSALFIRHRVTRSRVEEILARLEEQRGQADPAVEKELHDLGDRSVGVLAERLRQGRFGDGALRTAFLAVGAPAAEALAEALDDAKPAVRLFAAETLGHVEGGRDLIVHALTGALADRAAEVRIAAAKALGGLRVDARDAKTALLTCLGDSAAPVRAAAAAAIRSVASAEPDVIEALVKALADRDGQVRRAAVDTVAALGTPDEAIGALAELLGDDQEPPDVRWACVYAFRDTAPRGRQAIAPLREAVDGPDSHLAAEAIRVLGKYEVGRKATTAVLVRALANADGDVRAAAAASLANFGQEGRDATAALLTCLRDKTWAVRKAAATALGKVAAPQSQVPAALVKTLGDKDNQVRQAAVLALMDLGMPDGTITPIVRILDSDSEAPHIRWACAHALSRIGKRGRPAITALRKALNHDDPRLSKQAAEAIANIQAGTAAP